MPPSRAAGSQCTEKASGPMLWSFRGRFIAWRLKASTGGRRRLAVGFLAFVLITLVLRLLSMAYYTWSPTNLWQRGIAKRAALNLDSVTFSIAITNPEITAYSETFPQNGESEPGKLYRLKNSQLLAETGDNAFDSVLIMMLFNNAESWSYNRSVEDFFELVGSFDYPKSKINIAMLTSSMDSFATVQDIFQRQIEQYAQLSVIFRNDFAQSDLGRDNRHEDAVQGSRRRMLARYRNYALLSSLERWHQHVVWIDADISEVPTALMRKMTQSGRDIVQPLCARHSGGDNWYEYDLNAWAGERKVRAGNETSDFVPGPVNVTYMTDFHGGNETFVHLDSVGGAMLYVRAEVHRQGVLFPAHYVIGSEWGAEGYDGIETEGLCYTASFLGFTCWGMPNDLVFHAN